MLTRDIELERINSYLDLDLRSVNGIVLHLLNLKIPTKNNCSLHPSLFATGNMLWFPFVISLERVREFYSRRNNKITPNARLT